IDGRARDIGNEAGLGKIELRQDALDHVRHAGVLQADRVEHSGRRLIHAVRGVAEARLERGALENDGARIPIGEPFNPCVLLPEADATGEQHDRGRKGHPAELQPQAAGVVVGGTHAVIMPCSPECSGTRRPSPCSTSCCSGPRFRLTRATSSASAPTRAVRCISCGRWALSWSARTCAALGSTTLIWPAYGSTRTSIHVCRSSTVFACSP